MLCGYIVGGGTGILVTIKSILYTRKCLPKICCHLPGGLKLAIVKAFNKMMSQAYIQNNREFYLYLSHHQVKLHHVSTC